MRLCENWCCNRLSINRKGSECENNTKRIGSVLDLFHEDASRRRLPSAVLSTGSCRRSSLLAVAPDDARPLISRAGSGSAQILRGVQLQKCFHTKSFFTHAIQSRILCCVGLPLPSHLSMMAVNHCPRRYNCAWRQCDTSTDLAVCPYAAAGKQCHACF